VKAKDAKPRAVKIITKAAGLPNCANTKIRNDVLALFGLPFKVFLFQINFKALNGRQQFWR
jgi:hypothetical protein